jgi:hypothetical protein
MGYNAPQDYHNLSLERSVANFNFPQSFKFTWSYDLPIGKNRKLDLRAANWVLGGWQLAGIQQYRSGGPIGLGQSGLNTPAGFGSIRPDVISGVPVTLGGIPGTVDQSEGTQWINPAAFAKVPMTGEGVPLRVGTAPRTLSYLYGPRSMSEALRISKAFPIYAERVQFRIGATWQNPFKRTVPYITSTTVGDSNFGQLLLSGGGRTLQLDAHLDF